MDTHEHGFYMRKRRGKNSPELSRFEPPNREAAAFSLSSLGGEGWGEEALSSVPSRWFVMRRLFPHAGSQRCLQRIFGLVAAAWLFAAGCVLGATPKLGPEPALLVVMDPLARELACACVKGFGQRDYRKITTRLEKALK